MSTQNQGSWWTTSYSSHRKRIEAPVLAVCRCADVLNTKAFPLVKAPHSSKTLYFWIRSIDSVVQILKVFEKWQGRPCGECEYEYDTYILSMFKWGCLFELGFSRWFARQKSGILRFSYSYPNTCMYIIRINVVNGQPLCCVCCVRAFQFMIESVNATSACPRPSVQMAGWLGALEELWTWDPLV